MSTAMRNSRDSSSGKISDGVSIIIPNWNHEYTLPRAVDSALNAIAKLSEQSIPGEIIIVDDNSRDGSRSLLRQLEAAYYHNGLKVLLLDEQQGASNARNQGLKIRAFSYVVFLDADNELVPENTYQFYRSICATNASVVFGNIIVKEEGAPKFIFSNESIQEKIFNRNYLDTMALFNGSDLEALGGFKDTEKMKAHEDWELYLHMIASGLELVFVPLLFGYYHNLPLSHVSNRRCKQSIEARNEYIGRVYNQLEIRQFQKFNSRRLRFHPDVGYL